MRRTAFLWLAGLMTAIGLAAAAVSYVFVRNEASEFLDNQLRQIALYVGDVPPGAAEPPPDTEAHDPEDDFAIQIWDAGGRLLRESRPGLGIARQARTGFSKVRTPVDMWRVILYDSNSEPDAVTALQHRLENERYLFFRGGRLVTLELIAPIGTGHVDSWRLISNSFRWK